MNTDQSKIIRFEDLKEIRERHVDERLVLCHGVFDLLHVGHLKHFEAAHQFGDRLVVSLTPDEYVNKGPGRPYYNSSQRLKMLVALEVVDYVVINKHSQAMELIEALHPDVFVKGAEFQSGRDITGAIQKEKTAIESCGGRIEFTHDEVHSSGQLLNRFFGIWDKSQSEFIDTLKDNHDSSHLMDLVQAFSSKRVLIVGEPIIDHYVFCAPKSLSSKSPSVSVQRLYEEEYPGGILAVANHLAGLGCQVDLLMADNGGKVMDLMLEEGLDSSVNLEREMVESIPTIRKTRFVAEFQSTKLFEVFDASDDIWSNHSSVGYIQKMTQMAETADLVIALDYGHGLFEGSVLEALGKLQTFLALNVQVNSANHGYNFHTKHRGFDYLALDERELRLASQSRRKTVMELAKEVLGGSPPMQLSITLGGDGSLFFDMDDDEKGVHCPSFFKDVVDTTGAGDAYFSITSVLAQMRASPVIIPFMGNCMAGLQTRIIGNKEAVRQSEFLRTMEYILK